MSYIDPRFSSHYTGATNAGFIRGAYHFARPSSSTGADQAEYFIAHGGGWTADGITLPGMLDLEPGDEGNCWGMSATAMVNWVRDFSEQYQAKTDRYPMVYTTAEWWTECTGNSNAFVDTNPLVLAKYASSPGSIPGGWGSQTIWQNSDHFTYGGSSDIFNGNYTQLKRLASG
jgi:GH25 family lysozyme M1 (1,4-beta-N-acetylmuramidase)